MNSTATMPNRRVRDHILYPSGGDIGKLLLLIVVARLALGVLVLALYRPGGYDSSTQMTLFAVALFVSGWGTALPFLYAVLRYVTGHRAPWSQGPFGGAIGRRASNPSVGDLFLFWVVGVCTVVGYVFAIYATWRFFDGHRAPARSAPAGSLAHRLNELESARAAGLIDDEQYTTAKSAVLASL